MRLSVGIFAGCATQCYATPCLRGRSLATTACPRATWVCRKRHPHNMTAELEGAYAKKRWADASGISWIVSCYLALAAMALGTGRVAELGVVALGKVSRGA